MPYVYHYYQFTLQKTRKHIPPNGKPCLASTFSRPWVTWRIKKPISLVCQRVKPCWDPWDIARNFVWRPHHGLLKLEGMYFHSQVIHQINFSNLPIISKHHESKLMFPKIGNPPQSSILIGFSIINHPFWGSPIFGNTQMTIPWPVFFWCLGGGLERHHSLPSFRR